MTYACLFGFVSVYLGAVAVLLGGLGWLLLWPAVSALIVAGAYGGLGTGVFGKRVDGTLAWWAALPSLPYLGATWILWHLVRLVRTEACCHEVVPRLWIGRRPFAHELPAEVDLVVDLTAEFVEPRGVRTGRSYWCLPTLDNAVPADEAFVQLIRKLIAWPGGIYVHCASGHGRSATVAAAVLIARGLDADHKTAEDRIKRIRPGIRLGTAQRRLLKRVLPRLLELRAQGSPRNCSSQGG